MDVTQHPYYLLLEQKKAVVQDELELLRGRNGKLEEMLQENGLTAGEANEMARLRIENRKLNENLPTRQVSFAIRAKN